VVYREADSAASGFDTLSACEHPGEVRSLTKHRVRREHEAGQSRWEVGVGRRAGVVITVQGALVVHSKVDPFQVAAPLLGDHPPGVSSTSLAAPSQSTAAASG